MTEPVDPGGRAPHTLVDVVASYIRRADGALTIVLAIDAALLALLADTLRGVPEYRPVLLTTIVPMVLFGASLVHAGRGLVSRPSGREPEGNLEAGDRLRVTSQRFERKWRVLKRAALLTLCAVIWRFVAIQLA